MMDFDWWKILIEMGVLAFFALIYYLLQSRKINKYHHKDIVENYALWIYDYHHLLDELKDSSEYEELNAFIVEIEKLDLENDVEKKELIGKIPSSMPEDFANRLKDILSN